MVGKASQDSAPLLSTLLTAYAEPHRKYHNTHHIANMLRLLEEADVFDPAVYWATLYHDIVYVPGAGNNEKLSAIMAKTALTRLCIEPEVIASVGRIILATQKHILSNCPTTQAVLDADMAIIGADAASYQQYCLAIRSEYAAVPNMIFKLGRANFLKKLLKLPKIFGTQPFYEMFEANARVNISRELKGG